MKRSGVERGRSSETECLGDGRRMRDELYTRVVCGCVVADGNKNEAFQPFIYGVKARKCPTLYQHLRDDVVHCDLST